MGSVMGDVTGVKADSDPEPTSSLISSSRSMAAAQSSSLNGELTTFGFGGQSSMQQAFEAEKPAPVMHRQERSAGFNGMPTLDWGDRYAGTAPANVPQPAPAQVSASMSQQASSLRAVVQPAQESESVVSSQASNPYLNGIDFSGDLPKKQTSMAQKKLQTRKPTADELAS